MNLTVKTLNGIGNIPVKELIHKKQFLCNADGLVLYQRKDRLGARLEGMLSAWRFAKVTRRKLIVFWTDHPSASYDPAFLFDFNTMAESGDADDLSIYYTSYRDEFFKGEIIDLRAAPGWPFFLKKRDALSSQDRAIKIMTSHSTYFFLRWESPWRVANEIRELFPRLIPVVQIRDALSAALNWIGDPDFIAVHIRRGDVVRNTRRRLESFISRESEHGNSEAALDKLINEEGVGRDLNHFVKRVTSIDAYVAALPSNNQGTIVVFSDTPEAATEFQSRLKTSRSLLISSFVVEMTEVQRAYFELLILSKATRIISTASCFSRLACQCGRPSFHDARNMLGAAGTRAAFQELIGDLLNRSEILRRKCLQVLDRELALDRWVRMPDWLIARFPWLAWISLK